MQGVTPQQRPTPHNCLTVSERIPDRLFSQEARSRWVEPDRRPLDF